MEASDLKKQKQSSVNTKWYHQRQRERNKQTVFWVRGSRPDRLEKKVYLESSGR